MLSIGQNGNPEIQSYIDSLGGCGVNHEVFAGREANRRYPDQLKLPDSYTCVYEHNAGILRASKAVTTLQVSFSSIFITIYICIWQLLLAQISDLPLICIIYCRDV